MDNQNSQDKTKKDCPYCKDLKNKEGNSLSNCPYCQKIDETKNLSPDCPYCAAMEEEVCPYCNDPEIEENAPNTSLPTTTSGNDFAGQDLNEPEMPKPDPAKEKAPGLAPSIDSFNNVKPTPKPEMGEGDINPQDIKETVLVDHSKENLSNIANQIENAKSPLEESKQIDEADMPVATQMEDNISHPAGYDTEIPGEMGMSGGGQEDKPDMRSLLTETLEANKEDIRKEKVINIVSDALSGFKASKNILEQIKIQSPELYISSLKMLQAMIEMAKLMGFGEGQPKLENPLTQENIPPSPKSIQGESGWHEPFALHPDQGGTLQSGHAPETTKKVGQGVGKLPTSATTQHVAKEPLPEGAVNAAGQKMIKDPETGKISMIDMKVPRVLNEKGRPITGR